MRPPLVPALLLCAALASVGAGVWALLQRDRARLVQQLGADRLTQLEEATRGVGEALDDVGEDLRLAGSLLSQPGTPTEHQRELRALLEVVRHLKAVAAYTPDGSERLRLVDPRARPEEKAGAFFPALAQVARQALQQVPGTLATSPALGDAAGAWLRVFATALPGEGGRAGGAVAVLVDTEPLVSALRITASDPEARLLLLGPLGEVTSATDATLAQAIAQLEARAAHLPQLAGLLERMRQGERGVLQLAGREAQQLGLGRADAVVVFTSIRLSGGDHWAAATLVSSTVLHALERSLTARLLGAGALVALALLTFGAYVVHSERRAAALRESQRHAGRLAHLHEKTQKILDHIPTGVLALSAEGRISTVNQALRTRLAPHPAGTSLAQTFARAPSQVVARLDALVEAAVRDGQVRSLLGEPLVLFGEEGQYNIHAVPLETPDPEVHTLLVVEDLSNVRALETQLLRAEKLATVGVLAAGIAHEIGTPLGVVRGRAEHVLAKLGPEHPQAAGVGVIIEQIDRVSRTLRQLLDFSRLQPPAVRPVVLAPLVRGVQELLQLEAARSKVRLDIELPRHLPPLAADPDQLQQALVNIALNACHACSAGGRVRLVARAPDSTTPGAWGLVALEVEDDGCGIPAEYLNQVFDPFFTTKKRGAGTGLGLTVVAQIVRNHGGRVELESRPGAGTRVTLWWPAAGPLQEERHAV